jgi:hypothetical protein
MVIRLCELRRDGEDQDAHCDEQGSSERRFQPHQADAASGGGRTSRDR